ncbi:hypothetical protein F4V44_17020 [Niallia endozanthoxylica]|uniref:Uncharacterized protein n=2 Tax=Niallia endozanthoxylica TaxID=2036016 RepID=A0A5J5HLS5_9BACI|nr:hypothetical protein F4V44_17020 [Niallia endozanthoxylica]
MRFMFKQASSEDLESDLNMVIEILHSGYFMLIELFFWALLLTIVTVPAQHSLLHAVIFFFCYYVFGIGLFLLLRGLLKD